MKHCLKNVLWNSRLEANMNSTQTEKYFLTSSEDVRPNQITLKAFRLQKKIRWKMKGQADIYLKHRRCLNYKETEKIPAKDF